MSKLHDYLTEVGLNPHTGDTIDYAMGRGTKPHILQLVKKMEGLLTHLKDLEQELKKGDYKEWKKLSSINKKYDKFTKKFVDDYFSRH